MVLASLSSRPLRRHEVDTLGEADAIDGIFPLYGERSENRDTAFGVVIKVGPIAHALAHVDGDGWVAVEKREVTEGDGFNVDEMDLLDELWDAITDRLSVTAPVDSH